MIEGGVMTAVAEESDTFMPATAQAPRDRQRLFVRYFTGVLIDLTVLNLFVEYWDKVTIDSFTISLLAAILLQVLLKATITVEHWVGGFFKGKAGGLNTFLRFFFAWLVLFLSKFVILEALLRLRRQGQVRGHHARHRAPDRGDHGDAGRRRSGRADLPPARLAGSPYRSIIGTK